MTITRADFAKHINKNFGFDIAEAGRVVDIVFGEMRDALRRGEEIKITNFGTFVLRDKAERMGRNPKTGRPAVIAARRVPSFRAAESFKGELRG
ncbi:MAG: integration host factor subunit alpha [Rickettsiales bacterium]|jgi:integration host factor subunit alpha|nr:integration host factor subunit alpha [Rickettsiales bacterium]